MGGILVLGAGSAQIDLLEYCRNSGMEVHCCSNSSKDPGILFSDHYARIDIIEREEVEKYFRENHLNYIYSIGSDIAVPVFAETAKRTGTRCFVTPQAAEICCDKSRMRELLKGKYYCPAFYIGSDYDEVYRQALDFSWPMEIKPVDSQGQRGVSTVRRIEDLKAGFDNAVHYSRKREAILEQYIGGAEVSVNAYLYQGEIIFSILSDREVWPQYPGGIIHRHHIPSVYEKSDVYLKINDIVKNIVETLGLTDGPVYFQIMIQNGDPYLIEVTPRLDGCHLWRLIREACGTDLLDMTMNHLRFLDPLRGLKSAPGQIHVPKSKAVHLEFACQAPGEKVDNKDFLKKEAIYRSMYYQDGDIVEAKNGFMEKCGYRIYR